MKMKKGQNHNGQGDDKEYNKDKNGDENPAEHEIAGARGEEIVPAIIEEDDEEEIILREGVAEGSMDEEVESRCDDAEDNMCPETDADEPECKRNDTNSIATETNMENEDEHEGAETQQILKQEMDRRYGNRNHRHNLRTQ